LLESSRRQFLVTATLSTAGALLKAPLRAVAMQAETADGVSPAPARLDSGWEFRRGAIEGPWEAWRSEEDDRWEPTSLPHCFNEDDACDPDRPYFRGQGWYRTRLALSNPFTSGRTVLHFQGAGQTTTLWVGSTLVGTHKGGYDEFVFDITAAAARLSLTEVRNGTPIAILCDNSPDLDRVPSDLSDFCLYGGLYRHVNLVYLPAVALDAVHILPIIAADGSAQISVKARLYDPEGRRLPCTLAVGIFAPDGRSIDASKATLPAWTGLQDLTTFRLQHPELWSPDSPQLYRCTVTLDTSVGRTTLQERFGVRQLEFVEHGPFKLNGHRLLLKGTHRHADHAGVAAAMSDDLVRREMQMIRDMGANFIRLAHYQQDRVVLDLCDELGLMVWEEVPWCRAGVGSEAFQQNAQDMLTRMIDQHYNHPSIILWGLGNEDDWPDEYPRVDQEAIRGFVTTLRDIARSLDNSRLTALRRCDFARDIPDIYSPSIWAGWYSGNYREYEQSLMTQRDRVKRFIHIEWGADSQAGRHSEDPEAVLDKVATGKGTAEVGLAYLNKGGQPRVSKDGDWSESYACNLFDWHLKTQEKLDWLTGSAQWIFKDFASPLRDDSDIPRINQKGLVERDLTRKESYFVFQSYWASKPMAHIYGHSWPVRWGHEGEVRTVHVYSNCDRAELFLNGASMGAMERDSQNFPAAGLRWDVNFAKGPNRLHVVATRQGHTVTDDVDLFFQTEAWSKPTQLRLVKAATGPQRATAEVRAFDAKGVLCLDASNAIRFSLAGQGRLLDNLGTSRGSRELQLYNGRAQISIALTGECILGISSRGLKSAFLKLP
jgi:beta-galactosidase